MTSMKEMDVDDRLQKQINSQLLYFYSYPKNIVRTVTIRTQKTQIIYMEPLLADDENSNTLSLLLAFRLH